jgi:hypothetical protein
MLAPLLLLWPEYRHYLSGCKSIANQPFDRGLEDKAWFWRNRSGSMTDKCISACRRLPKIFCVQMMQTILFSGT